MQPIQAGTKVSIVLPIEAVNVLLAGAAELPFKVSADVIGEVQRQTMAQVAAAGEPQQEPAQAPEPKPEPEPKREAPTYRPPVSLDAREGAQAGA